MFREGKLFAYVELNVSIITYPYIEQKKLLLYQCKMNSFQSKVECNKKSNQILFFIFPHNLSSAHCTQSSEIPKPFLSSREFDSSNSSKYLFVAAIITKTQHENVQIFIFGNTLKSDGTKSDEQDALGSTSKPKSWIQDIIITDLWQDSLSW